MNLPDIKRNGFNFTDGVGYISEELATKIAQNDFRATRASAFQIRIAGAKGVLMVRPGLEGPIQVQLRDSQIKFPSPDLSLNIIRMATFSQGFLNRQIITLLHCLGVPEEYFIMK